MRIWPEKTQDQEFNGLGSRGFKGSLNDRQFAYLLEAGYKGALADMMTSYRAYTPNLLFTGSEPGFWFDPSDMSTLFQDSAGTTPVTAAGQPVGLALDKSKGLVLGPEQHQGDISASPWSTVGTLSSVTENSYTNSSGAGAGVALFVGLGKCVRVDVKYSKDTASSFSIRRSGDVADTAEYAASTELTGSFSVTVSMTGILDKVYLRLAGNGKVTFSNISVRELPGFHATATGTKRPTLQIDTSGRPYLSFDGVDDALVTSTITPGTDKVQVFAGVRKLSDAARGMLVESNNGSTNRFAIEAPPSGLKGYIGASGGSTVVFTPGTLEFAPDSAVLTLQGDISGDSVSLRRNGASLTPATTDQGTGTYAASAINIGARAGTSLFFNGRLYGLIGRFGPNLSTERIKNAETWLNTKTGIYG